MDVFIREEIRKQKFPTIYLSKDIVRIELTCVISKSRYGTKLKKDLLKKLIAHHDFLKIECGIV